MYRAVEHLQSVSADARRFQPVYGVFVGQYQRQPALVLLVGQIVRTDLKNRPGPGPERISSSIKLPVSLSERATLLFCRQGELGGCISVSRNPSVTDNAHAQPFNGEGVDVEIHFNGLECLVFGVQKDLVPDLLKPFYGHFIVDSCHHNLTIDCG